MVTNVYAVQGRIVTYSCVCKTASMLEAQLRSLYSAARPSHAEFKVYNPVQLPTLLQAIKVILCKQLLCYLKNKLKKTQQCKRYSLFRTITSPRNMHSNHSTALIACWLLHWSILTRDTSTYGQANSVKFVHTNIAQILFQRCDIM